MREARRFDIRSALRGEDPLDEERRPVSVSLSTTRKHQLDGLPNDLRVVPRVIIQQPHERDGQLVGPHEPKPVRVKVVALGLVLNEAGEIRLQHGVGKCDKFMH